MSKKKERKKRLFIGLDKLSDVLQMKNNEEIILSDVGGLDQKLLNEFYNGPEQEIGCKQCNNIKYTFIKEYLKKEYSIVQNEKSYLLLKKEYL